MLGLYIICLEHCGGYHFSILFSYYGKTPVKRFSVTMPSRELPVDLSYVYLSTCKMLITSTRAMPHTVRRITGAHLGLELHTY